MRWLGTAAMAAAGAAMSVPLAAQTAIHHPSAQAQAPALAPVYRNVFTETPSGVVQDRADWRRANDEVGQFQRGHVDLLKWEAQQGVGVQPPAPGQPTAPHGGHR